MQIVFGGSKQGAIRDSLGQIVRDSESLSLAVSYIRMSGWKIFRELTKHIPPERIRIVCTEQLGVTDPDVVREALTLKMQIRRYSGANVFHSKLYIGEQPKNFKRFLIGSANLSDSALNSGVEVAVCGDDPGNCSEWFEDLFRNRSSEFDRTILEAMDKAFTARVRSSTAALSAMPKVQRPTASEDIVESIFASIKSIALLNLDQAGNNVRNLGFALEVLQKGDLSNGKKRSEMNLLGFAQGQEFTQLGQQARTAKNISELARIWIRWLKHVDEKTLEAIGNTDRLIRAKSAFNSFWKMDKSLTDYFTAHAANPSDEQKRVCQIIELLANAGTISQTIEINQAKQLISIYDDLALIPDAAAQKIKAYFDNKGARNWEVPDRPLLTKLWREV